MGLRSHCVTVTMERMRSSERWTRPWFPPSALLLRPTREGSNLLLSPIAALLFRSKDGAVSILGTSPPIQTQC